MRCQALLTAVCPTDRLRGVRDAASEKKSLPTISAILSCGTGTQVHMVSGLHKMRIYPRRADRLGDLLMSRSSIVHHIKYQLTHLYMM